MKKKELELDLQNNQPGWSDRECNEGYCHETRIKETILTYILYHSWLDTVVNRGYDCTSE